MLGQLSTVTDPESYFEDDEKVSLFLTELKAKAARLDRDLSQADRSEIVVTFKEFADVQSAAAAIYHFSSILTHKHRVPNKADQLMREATEAMWPVYTFINQFISFSPELVKSLLEDPDLEKYRPLVWKLASPEFKTKPLPQDKMLLPGMITF